jgi:uncharacterized protein YjeT (DUF2065 family)
MTDFTAAGQLVLAVEGLLWGAAPCPALRLALIAAAQTPEDALRCMGDTAGIGAIVVRPVRG